jgi:membrane associated rhomboid family serine protease
VSYPAVPGEAATPPALEPRSFPRALLLLGLVLYTIAGVLSATIEILLVPLRVGTVLVPVAVFLAIVGNIALPRLSRTLTTSLVGALPPVIAWIVTLVVLMSTRPEGDVLLPGGGSVQWVSYGVMLGGLFTGLITVALLADTGARRRRHYRAEREAAQR